MAEGKVYRGLVSLNVYMTPKLKTLSRTNCIAIRGTKNKIAITVNKVNFNCVTTH